MKFYDCQPAPSPRRARMAIAEKGLEIETVQVDLGAQEQLGEAFKAISPQCTVPVLLLDDGTALCENVAIAHYLETLQPEPPLFGTNDLEKALVLEWNIKIEIQGLSAIAEILRNSAKGFQGRATTGPMNHEQIPELAARGRARFQNFFPMLEQQLQGKTYITGDSFSIADITAFVVAEFAGWVKESIPDDCSAVHDWYGRIKQRPSASL